MNNQTQNKFKPSGKFNPLGMLATLVIGILSAVIIGAISYGISSILRFGIPLLIPGIAGFLVGLITSKLGSTIGQYRNLILAISVGILCGIVAGVTVHVVDYFWFRGQFFSTILNEAPYLIPAQIRYVLNQWLFEQTGRSGLIGFLILKAMSNSVEFSFIVSGAALPPFNISESGLIVYWFIEIILIAGIAGFSNSVYPKKSYCDQCKITRKTKIPVIGTDANLADSVEAFKTLNITKALKLLTENSEGNIVRLVVEYCPGCFDSFYSKLVAT